MRRCLPSPLCKWRGGRFQPSLSHEHLIWLGLSCWRGKLEQCQRKNLPREFHPKSLDRHDWTRHLYCAYYRLYFTIKSKTLRLFLGAAFVCSSNSNFSLQLACVDSFLIKVVCLQTVCLSGFQALQESSVERLDQKLSSMLLEGMPTGGFQGLQCENTPERGTALYRTAYFKLYIGKHPLSYHTQPTNLFKFDLEFQGYRRKDTISNCLLTVYFVTNYLHNRNSVKYFLKVYPKTHKTLALHTVTADQIISNMTYWYRW